MSIFKLGLKVSSNLRLYVMSINYSEHQGTECVATLVRDIITYIVCQFFEQTMSFDILVKYNYIPSYVNQGFLR